VVNLNHVKETIIMSIQTSVVRRTQVPALLGLSIATIDRLRREGNFPPAIRLGPQSVGFFLGELEAWLISRQERMQ
jgi:prophage regulatory protein